MLNPDLLTAALCALPFSLLLIIYGGLNFQGKRISRNKLIMGRILFSTGVIMFFGLIIGIVKFLEAIPDGFWTNTPL